MKDSYREHCRWTIRKFRYLYTEMVITPLMKNPMLLRGLFTPEDIAMGEQAFQRYNSALYRLPPAIVSGDDGTHYRLQRAGPVNSLMRMIPPDDSCIADEVPGELGGIIASLDQCAEVTGFMEGFLHCHGGSITVPVARYVFPALDALLEGSSLPKAANGNAPAFGRNFRKYAEECLALIDLYSLATGVSTFIPSAEMHGVELLLEPVLDEVPSAFFSMKATEGTPDVIADAVDAREDTGDEDTYLARIFAG